MEELLLANTLSLATPQLRRLPILSTQHKSGKTDFEWPTEAEITEMVREQVLKITKVEIWYYSDYNFMTGVRVTLSNGR